MKKRRKLILLALVSLLVLAGWGQKKVELLSDKKLIDLSAAIGNCTLGADDMTPDDGTSTQNPEGQEGAAPTATPTPGITPRPTAKPTTSLQPTVKPADRTIIISVRDEEILYDLRSVDDMEMLEKLPDIDDKQVITIFTGKGVSENESNEIAEKIMEQYPLIEVGCIYGGQELYDFYMAIE